MDDRKEILVEVTRIEIPAMSTVGLGWGFTDDGTVMVQFIGDHRPMRAMGEAIAQGDIVLVEVPAGAVLAVREAPQE